MIKDLDNYNLFMFQGDTGTITFNMSGDIKLTDSFLFGIKKSLDDTDYLFSKTYTGDIFTVEIDENASKLFTENDYLWGLKLLRTVDDNNTIDTIVGQGTFKVKRGV